MPAPVGRDLELTRAQLLGWFENALPDASDVEVGELTGPGGTGFSSDTLLFDLTYREAAECFTIGLVARIHPTGFQLFPEYDLPAQYRIMAALAESDVKVPKMLWEEPTGDVIGSPFYVMEQIQGEAPADNPPYTAEGWLKDLAPKAQSRLWLDYVETLAAVHRVDPFRLGLGFLQRPDLGETPVEQELAYYEHFYRWSFGTEGEHPTVGPSLRWLRANRPAAPDTQHLVWGDARIGNMIFENGRVAAVLDWEMARIGDPMMDLAWGLFMDRFHTEGNGVDPLPGFPDREETIRLYESLSPCPTDTVEYYEILAGMRFSVILIRLAKQLKHYEFLPAESDFEINNPVSNLHRVQLENLGIL